MPDPISPWAAEQLRDDQVELLAGLPLSATVEVSGLGTTVFCHATPRDDEEVVLVDSRPARWAEVFADLDASVRAVVCGHTHMPFARLADRRLVVNPGSIGMPYGGAGAHWALLGPGVELRVTEFDLDKACDRIVAESGYPDAREWADYFVRSIASDMEAIAAFGPRDGRAGPGGEDAGGGSASSTERAVPSRADLANPALIHAITRSGVAARSCHVKWTTSYPARRSSASRFS